MSGMMDNIWASELDEDDNVWDDNVDDSVSHNDSQPSESIEQSSNHSSTHSDDESDIEPENHNPIINNTSAEDTHAYIWDDPQPQHEIAPNIASHQSDNIWGSSIVHHDNKDATPKEESVEVSNPIEVREIDEQHIESNIVEEKEEVEDHENNNTEETPDGDDDFDDFGDFEEIPTGSLTFEKPVSELLEAIFSGIKTGQKEEAVDDENETFDKSRLLVKGGVRPMKCYNTLTSNDRQYLADKILTINTRQRGCIEKMELHKSLVGIVGEWIYDEKGVYSKTDDTSKSSWKDIGKNSLFRWSTKTETEDPKDKEKNDSVYNINERKLIGQKLLNASFEQSRKIIEERLDSEKKQKMALEKAKWEREQRLKKEQLKREEEMAKYNTESVEMKETKKKGFFGKMFSGKSKIAKDHISHKKVQTEDDGTEVVELSLKEQMERDGYNLSKGKGKKGKSKNDHDDNDEDDDNDFDVTGYNVLDPNANVGDTSDVFAAQHDEEDAHAVDDDYFNHTEPKIKPKELSNTNTPPTAQSQESDDASEEQYDEVNEESTESDSEDNFDDDDFDYFQTSAIPCDIPPPTPVNQSNNSTPQPVIENLIDL